MKISWTAMEKRLRSLSNCGKMNFTLPKNDWDVSIFFYFENGSYCGIRGREGSCSEYDLCSYHNSPKEALRKICLELFDMGVVRITSRKETYDGDLKEPVPHLPEFKLINKAIGTYCKDATETIVWYYDWINPAKVVN